LLSSHYAARWIGPVLVGSRNSVVVQGYRAFFCPPPLRCITRYAAGHHFDSMTLRYEKIDVGNDFIAFLPVRVVATDRQTHMTSPLRLGSSLCSGVVRSQRGCRATRQTGILMRRDTGSSLKTRAKRKVSTMSKARAWGTHCCWLARISFGDRRSQSSPYLCLC